MTQKKWSSLLLLVCMFELAVSKITIRNSMGKALGNNYIQEVSEETELFLSNGDVQRGVLNGGKQLPLLIQKEKENCNSDVDCLNEGVCHEQVCYCKTYFVGPICQYQLNNPMEINDMVFIILCALALAIGISVIILINYIIKYRQEQKLNREGEYNDNHFENWKNEP